MKRKLLYTLAFLFATLQTFAQTTYTYDDLNRLTTVKYGNGVTVTYTYDALGNRISKKVTGASNPKEAYAWMSSDSKTLTFCYDDKRAERKGETYDLNTGYNYAGWNPDPWSTVSSVTTVVFESSFASVRPTNMYTWFCNFQNLTKITGLNYLNTSEVTNMYSLFRDCKSLTSLDLSHLNTSNVTDMGYMFYNCINLTSIDVSGFDTSKVDDMAGMFNNCSSLTILDVSHFNTSKVERFNYMFKYCSSLTSLDVSNFDTSKIKESYSMFRACSSLRTLTISSFMGNIHDEACFGVGTSSSPCTLIAPDGFDYGVDTSGNYFQWKLGYFKISGTKEAYAVYNNGTLTFYYDDEKSSREGTVYNDLNTDNNVPGWCDHNDITKVVFDSSFADARPTTTKCWFYYLNNMTSMEGMEYLNTSKVTNMAYMFDGCSSLASLDVSHFDTSNVEDMYSMFSGCSSLTSLDVSHFDTSNVKDMAYLFNRCNGLTGLDVSHFNTSKVTNMRYMFEYCKSLTSLDVSNFDTSNVTDMCCMFDLCWSLTSLDVSHFNTSNVTNMSWMFYYCCAPNLDVSHFDTSKVTNMSSMFYACFYLTSLDVSHFDTSNVTNMSSMFSQCEALTDLDVSNFDTSKCEDTGRMFFYCHSLKSLALSSTMENLDETACDRVGSTSSPCALIAPENFNFGVDTSGNYFLWKGGYFKASNSSGFANGDVNHDTEVNVVDVMLTVSYVLKKETPNFHFENADINGSGEIDVVDVMGIVNIILKKPAMAHSVPTLATSDRIEAFSMNDGIGLSLSNAQRYTALEMTLTLPSHATLAKATLNGSTNHSVVTQALGDGMYRIVVYSLTGEALPNSDALIHLTISGAGNININDVLLTNTFFDAITPQEATGISIYAGTNGDDTSPAYRTDGVQAMPTQRGIIIQNGRKQVRKR